MFKTRLRASMEDRSPWGDFWFSPVGMRSMAGMNVTPTSAMTLSAVFRAVALISSHLAMLPIVAYKPGTRERVKHPLLKLLNKRPNEFQNAFEFREMLQGHLLLRGNAYSRIVVGRRGEITDLIPIHPDSVQIEGLSGGDWRYKIKQQDGTYIPLLRDEVWHLRGLSNNGVQGISVIEAARESMGLTLAAQGFGARFFANDARPSSGWVEFPGQIADKAARDMFRESIQDAQSAANRGKLMVLDRGMKYHDIGLNNTDAQFLESRKFQVEEIARWFGVPPHKIGALDKATNNNIEMQSLEFIQDTQLNWTERWESAIEYSLLLEGDETEFDHDFGKYLKADSAARSEYYGSGIQWGWLMRSDARNAENLAPVPGLEKPLIPVNMAVLGEDGLPIMQKSADSPAQEPDGDETEPDGDEQESKKPSKKLKNARLAAILGANARRIATRAMRALEKQPAEAVFCDEFAALVAETMVFSLNDGKAFCAHCKSISDELTAEKIVSLLTDREPGDVR